MSVSTRPAGRGLRLGWPRADTVSPAAAAVAACVVVGAALRFATLTSQSFWFDEAQLSHEVQLSFGALLSTIGHQETSPPLYFVLAWLWAKVFGGGEAGLRSLSALCGVAMIPLAYGCGRELVSRRTGVIAALFTTVSPFLIWYSQEAREYMLLGLLSAASLWGFARAWRGGGAGDVWLWAITSALALLTHFFAGFLVLPEALMLLWRRRDRAVLGACTGLVAVQAALLPLAISDTGHPLGWLSSVPLSTRVDQVPVTFALNTLYRTAPANAGLLGAAVVLAVVIVLLIGAAPERDLRGAALAGAVAACVILVPLACAELGHDFFIARALMPAWLPLAVVLAAAATVPRWRLAGAFLGLAAVAAFVFASVRIGSERTLQRPDWRAVARALGPATRPRAVVAYDGSLASDPLALYLPGVPWAQPRQPVVVSEVDVVAGPLEQPLRRLPPGVTVLARHTVSGFVVTRFGLVGPWEAPLTTIGARAGTLLGPAPANPAVLLQRPRA